MDQLGYLPLKKAAAWAGVSRKTLKRWLAAGLPCYRACPRGKVLVRPADIDHFLTREAVPQVDVDRIVDEVVANVVHRL